MSCTSGCPTPGEHDSWGACLRAKALQIQPGIQDAPYRKSNDRELEAYKDARAEGIQPKGTRMKQVEAAKKFADVTGVGNPWQQ